jgi:Flp pilus assembly pilin Flp
VVTVLRPKLKSLGIDYKRTTACYDGLLWTNATCGKLAIVHISPSQRREDKMAYFLQKIWPNDEGQDVAEYAVMLAVILTLALGTVKAIGGNATAVFSRIGSTIQ